MYFFKYVAVLWFIVKENHNKPIRGIINGFRNIKTSAYCTHYLAEFNKQLLNISKITITTKCNIITGVAVLHYYFYIIFNNCLT